MSRIWNALSFNNSMPEKRKRSERSAGDSRAQISPLQNEAAYTFSISLSMTSSSPVGGCISGCRVFSSSIKSASLVDVGFRRKISVDFNRRGPPVTWEVPTGLCLLGSLSSAWVIMITWTHCGLCGIAKITSFVTGVYRPWSPTIPRPLLCLENSA